jgi:predicted DNA-binding protein (UPF0251 family)
MEATVFYRKNVTSMERIVRVVLGVGLAVVDTQMLSGAHAGDPVAMTSLLVALRPDIRRYAAYQCGRALESLPLGYRQVIVMRDFEELTIGEMAERLGLSREATKSRLHRARGMVREYMLATRAVTRRAFPVPLRSLSMHAVDGLERAHAQ